MNKSSLVNTILFAWLVAGTLDILGAIFILANGNAEGTFRYIASAMQGKEAYTGGTSVIFIGVLIHFAIALAWTLTYFFLYKKIKFDAVPLILSALLYGVFIYVVMTYVLLPFTKLPPRKQFESSQIPAIIKNIGILAVAFGITLRLFAGHYFSKTNR